MTAPLLSIPGFGQADLSNCEREQIQLAGSIQPHGALLVLDEPGLTIVQATENAASFLGVRGRVLGRAVSDILPALAVQLGAVATGSLEFPAVFRCRIGRRSREF